MQAESCVRKHVASAKNGKNLTTVHLTNVCVRICLLNTTDKCKLGKLGNVKEILLSSKL